MILIRVTFELLPGGNETRARTIGIMEIANIKTFPDNTAEYAVVLKKTPPFNGALKLAWKKAKVGSDDKAINSVLVGEDEELITGLVTGHHRTKRGIYDLLFRALVACGLDKRNKI